MHSTLNEPIKTDFLQQSCLPYPYDLSVIFASYITEATEFSALQADVHCSSVSALYC